MQVRFIQSVACGADVRYDLPETSFAPGALAEIDDVLAGHWVNSGICEEYTAPVILKPARASRSKVATIAIDKTSGDLRDACDDTAAEQDEDEFPGPGDPPEEVTGQTAEPVKEGE